MNSQKEPYRVEDPRFADRVWVAKGLWPDCPDCQGLLAANVGPTPPLFPRDDEVLEPVEIPFPCPTCHDRTVESGIEISQHFWGRGPVTLYGTWPDCTDCQGTGGRWYESSWDGHRSEHDIARCGTCRARTKKFLSQHPTALDHVLLQQRAEVAPHIANWQRLLREIQETEKLLKELSHKHNQALEEHTEQMINQLYSKRQVADPL